MKPIRNIILLTLVIAILGVGFYFVTKYEPADDVATPTLPPSEVIFKTDREAIEHIAVTNGDESYSLNKVDGQWLMNNDSSIKLLTSKITTYLYDCATVSVKETVEENALDLSVYGLDMPMRKVTVTSSDGTSTTVLIGNQSIDGSICYLMLEGKNTVYIKTASGCDSLVMPLSKLLDTAVYSLNPEEIGGVTLDRPGTEFIRLERNLAEKEDENETDSYIWQMKAPLEKLANEYNINEQMIEKISAITAKSVIPHMNANGDYGFDAPRAVYSVWNLDGSKKYTVTVGKEEGTDTYIKVDTETSVYLVDTESISFINMSYQQLIDTLIHIENITEVSEIKIEGLGKNYHLTISGPEGNETYTINGKNIEEKEFKKAYQTVIGYSLSSFTDEPVTGTPVLTTTYTRKDGTVNKVECIDYDDRNYVVLVNGSGNQLIRKKQVETMIAQLDKNITE